MPDGWLNVDGSWAARLAKRPGLLKALQTLKLVPRREGDEGFKSSVFTHDLSKPLPFPEGTFTGVYASHTLEHMWLDEGGRVLRECLRVLKPGGVCRMVVPDLRHIILEYMGQFDFGKDDVYSQVTDEVKRTVPRADILNMRLLLRDPTAPRGNLLLKGYRTMKDFHSHKWMYDAESLAYHMKRAGFVEVQERGLHESRIPGIQDVERPERVRNGVGICVEGLKPGR
ncbi:MAG: class I SAM-dependent methyltransferase [Planctomycetota bacterium]|nr:class I SAM-dependent methyltransferase [Planctomycetota bacterium]